MVVGKTVWRCVCVVQRYLGDKNTGAPTSICRVLARGGLFLMSEVPLYRGTSLTRKAFPQDPTVGVCPGPCDGPRRRVFHMSQVPLYRGTSLTRKRHPLGPCNRTML